MNNLFNSISIVIIGIFFTVNVFAQATCTEASANQTEPLHLKNSQFLKNFAETGVLYSTAYGPAADVRYNLVNKKRKKVSWSFESSYSNNDGLQGFTVAINKYIGKRGLYLGVNGEVARFDIEYVDGHPTVDIPFLGIQFGWKHYWDQNRRLASLLQVGADGVQYQFKNIVMPEARAGIFYRIGGGKVPNKKPD